MPRTAANVMSSASKTICILSALCSQSRIYLSTSNKQKAIYTTFTHFKINKRIFLRKYINSESMQGVVKATAVIYMKPSGLLLCLMSGFCVSARAYIVPVTQSFQQPPEQLSVGTSCTRGPHRRGRAQA